MNNSIKTKISVLAISLLLMLSVVLSIFTFIDLHFDKRLLRAAADFSFTTSAENINKNIIELEHNALELALIGKLYYQGDKDTSLAEYTIKTIFKDYPISLGGGIWFEPYIVDSSKKNNCIFAFRNKKDQIVIDEQANSEQNDYISQSWYKEISSQLSPQKHLAWSKPYYDKQGSYKLMTTVGTGIYDKDKLIGISTVDWEIGKIIKTIQEANPTDNSFTLFADKHNDYIIALATKDSFEHNIIGHSLKELPWYRADLNDNDVFEYNGTKYVSFVQNLQNNMTLIINIPQNELYKYVNLRSNIIYFLLIISCLIITQIFYVVLKKSVSQPIEKLIEKMTKIGQGNLDVKVDLDNSTEFVQLSETINTMTQDIKKYIKNINEATQEKEKIQSELKVAHEIQYSVLPSDFLTNIKEMNIYARMQTAKEVGGDWYDFYFLDENHFIFLVGDVAGKGITASLMMMTIKALIRSSQTTLYTSKERIRNINKLIYENNKLGIFVTLFAAVIDLSNGDIDYINCGHNPPLIKRNGEYEYLRLASNLVLGICEDFEYEVVHSHLNPGDILFLYTDGVTEAFSEQEEQYTEKRLIQCLNNEENKQNVNVQEITENVFKSVKAHAGNREQSDDITILTFKYNGKEQLNTEQQTLVIDAQVDKYPEVCAWLEENCEKFEISPQYAMKLELVTEEIFVNIASYAYPNSDGKATITLTKIDNQIILKFEDTGTLYNPLTQTPPNIYLELEQRNAGGLGIYMVKQTVNDIEYQNIDNKNILTLKLNIN